MTAAYRRVRAASCFVDRQTVHVFLFHGTDDEGVQGIQADGFKVSHVRDSAGRAWFADTPEGATTGSADRRWLVIVDLPADIAEIYRYRFDDGEPYLGNFCVPFDVVNAAAPFRFEKLL